MFDYVNVSDDRFCCSEGHSLCGEEFQTKDLENIMATYQIAGNKFSPHSRGYCADPRDGWKPFLGRISIYTSCDLCPAFVQKGTYNLVPCWVEFDVEIVDDNIRSITRTSPPTKEWLETEPKSPYMEGCFGPMPWKAANELHLSNIGRPIAISADKP